MNLIRQDIANSISIKTGLDAKTSSSLARQVIELICDGIVEDRNVLLTGFGRFEALLTKPRKARDMKKGSVIFLDQKLRVRFKPSKKLLSRLNDVRRN